MDVNGINAETGEAITVENKSIDQQFIEWANTVDLPDSNLRKTIENLDLSADVKSYLFSIASTTIKVGSYIVSLGRKILDCVINTFKAHPNAGFGVVFGAVAGFLVTSIPFIGSVLGGFVTPILIAMGIIGGLKEDLKDKELKRKITEINGRFEPLRA